MVWEFPAVSQSRVEFWKQPQFTKSGMWWFTLAFGFFGLHHLYLRSPQTALIFCIANFVTLGFPWLYDLIQLSSVESLDSLNKHGLNYHFGALGIAQGMWKEPQSFMNSFSSPGKAASPEPAPEPSAPFYNSTPSAPFYNSAPSAPYNAPAPEPSAPYNPPAAAPAPTAPRNVSDANLEQDAQYSSYAASELRRRREAMEKQSGGALDEGPPNPIWFLLYALLIPAAPLAQLIAGDTNNAVSRFLDLTIIPLGFLFYLCAFVYDYMILILWPADLFVAGSKRFFPFTYLGMDPEGHSERLTGVSEIKPCPADGFIMTMFRISLPILSVVAPGLAESIKAALDTAQRTKNVVVDQGLEKINKATRIAKQAGDIATTVGSLSPTMLQMPQVPQLPQVPQMPQVPQVPQVQVPFMESTSKDTKYIDITGKRFGTMVGGALPKEPFSPLDYAALGSLGAVIAGGFILSLNRKSKNDSPPKPGRV